MIDPVADRLQWEQNKLRDELARLTARVAALEAGAPLPPEPKVEIQPTIPAPVQSPSTPEPQPEVEKSPIPDISVGWIGGRRGQ